MTLPDLPAPATDDAAAHAEIASGEEVDALLAQIVDGILEQSRPALAEAIRLAAIPFWVDRPLLAALRAKQDGQDDKLFDRLERYTFVTEQADHLVYNRDVRRHLLHRWQSDPAGFAEANRRALTYFQAQLAASEPYTSPYEAATQAILYHTLAIDPTAGVTLLEQLVNDAGAEHRVAAAERYVSIAEEQRELLPPAALAALDYAQGLVDQLYERWAPSRERLENILARDATPADLQTRCRRSLGRTLVNEKQWVTAIALYQQALAAFQAQGDRREAALTMNDIGRAYLDLGLNTWGGGEPFQIERASRFRLLSDLAGWFTRLPLVLFLIIRLGPRPLLPVLHRIGRGMDWVIARLFGTAATWFKRAEKILVALDDHVGLATTREDQVYLYLALNHPREAEAVSRSLLQTEGAVLGEYRTARAQLNLAQALLRQRKAAEGASCLEQAQPVFVSCGHRKRIAETYTELAHAAVLQDDFDTAAAHYEKAIAAWREAGEPNALTDTVEEAEALVLHPRLSLQACVELSQTSKQVTRRDYPIRYIHPLVDGFQIAALIALAIVFFFALFLGIRTETGTAVDASAALVTPQYRPPGEEFSPRAELTIEQQTTPIFKPLVAGAVIGWAAAGYLIVYTVLGLYLIIKAPLASIQQGQFKDVTVDEQGVKLFTEPKGVCEYPWDEVKSLAIYDRRILGQLMASMSGMIISGDGPDLHISGLTRHYASVQQGIRERLEGPAREPVAVYDTSFSILGGRAGWLFWLALGYLAAFVVLANFRSSMLTDRSFIRPYALADLYSLGYLGLAAPLGWWFGVKPLRARLLVRSASPLVWAAGGIGLVFAVLSILQLSRGFVNLPRPDIAPGLLGAFLLGLTATHVVSARWRPGEAGDATQIEQRAGPVYPPAVRWGTLSVALLLIAATLFAVGREVLSFHQLVRGNSYAQTAEKQIKTDPAGAHANYEQALLAYGRSQSLRPKNAATLNNLGLVSVQLNQYEAAITHHQEALDQDPSNALTYRGNIALAYEAWAADRTQATDRIALYEQAIRIYDELINEIARSATSRLIMYRLLRGGARYQQGQILFQGKSTDPAQFPKYEAARQDYQWIIDNAGMSRSNRAIALAGRGWVDLQLRRQFKSKSDQWTGKLETARADFLMATSLDPEQMSAYTGLAWSYYFISQGLKACEEGYSANTAEAIKAIDQVIARDPNGAYHYRTRAQLKYILGRYCSDKYDRDAQYRAAIADYDLALRYGEGLEPASDLSQWWYTQGNLQFIVADYAEAATSYASALNKSPTSWNFAIALSKAYLKQGPAFFAEAAAADAQAVELMPEDQPTAFDEWKRLGWDAYTAGDYALSVEVSGRAMALRPGDPSVIFNQGLAYLAASELDAAEHTYSQGITVAERLAPKARWDRFAEAVTDLRKAQGIGADPAGAAPGLIKRLEAAWRRPYGRPMLRI